MSTASANDQLKRAYVALDKMKQRLQENEAKSHEPIAIVGMGCRFPGAADTPEDFWQLLSEGRDGLRDVPQDRWDMQGLYSEEQGAVGKMYTRQAAFVERVGEFEPEFFGLSPREAKSMDPQQRLLMEVVWESLENANIIPEQLRESDTGMFLGIGQNDYGLLQLYSDDYARINSYDGSGNGFCFASGRISYSFGWQGPCLSVDTACSSSLVAVHLACQALRKGESKIAVAAGVQLMLTPNIALFLSRVGALAPDGRSKAFSADADGYGRGEGCGAVVLKRLSDAQADGDEIIALIRGSAVNHDGPGSGLTVPNGLAQQKLLRSALKNARVKPQQVSYVEAHGTGTVLGDPIEAEALGHVFSQEREADNPLYIGSVKTNVGHLETAAGIVSLIKTALALKHQQIPASINFSQPNPHIPWQRYHLQIPNQLTAWNSQNNDRYAGVSSFGMSGTNAHLILQQAPNPIKANGSEESPTKMQSAGVSLLTLAAKHEEALHLLAGRYANRLAQIPHSQLGNFCYSANRYRSPFSHRLAVLVSNQDQLLADLNEYLQHPDLGENAENRGRLKTGSCSEWRKPKIAFLFTGQGAQFPGMGQRLYQSDPVFRQAVDECDQVLNGRLDYSAYQLISDEIEPEALKTYAQPALFILQYALLKLWNSWGVEAQVLIGHSVGEYAAACHAGIFSLADGLDLIIARSQSINQYALSGTMVAVAAASESVQEQINNYQQRYAEKNMRDKVAIATINAPRSCVISGLIPEIQELQEYLQQQGLSCQPLSVAHGFHSPAMQPVLAPFQEHAKRVNYSQSQKKIISTVSGEVADGPMSRAEYWVEHIRQPVQFSTAIQTLIRQQEVDICIEIGPKAILTSLAMQSYSAWKKESSPHNAQKTPNQAAREYHWIKSLGGKNNSRADLLDAAAQLYCHGVELNWDRVTPGVKMTVPSYTWERHYYWVDSVAAGTEEQQPNAQATVLSAAAKQNAESTTNSEILTQLIEGDTESLMKKLTADEGFDEQQRELSQNILQRLSELYQHEQLFQQHAQAIYHIEWNQYQSKSDPTESRQVWLLIADQGGIAQVVAEKLKAQGHRVILVENRAQLIAVSAEHYQFPLSQSQQWETFFKRIHAEGIPPIQAGMDFRFCDLMMPKQTQEKKEEPQIPIVADMLAVNSALIKTLNVSGASWPLWLVTQNAFSSDVNGWLGAVAWGLGRVMAVEAEAFFGGLIELENLAAAQTSDSMPTSISEISIDKLVALMPSVPRGEQLRIDNQQVSVARLKQHSLTPKHSRQLRGDYLITGGLGGVGLAIANWLIQHYSLNLWLVSRRQPRVEILDELEQLQQIARQKGVSVHIIQADMGDSDSVQQMFTDIAESGAELKGIIHAAGVLQDGSIETHDAESYAKLMQAKVTGAWNLHQYSQGLVLDDFILFSSAAAVFGSPGQANYAAANAAMDGLARYRQQMQLPALAINWGAWADAGMVTQLSATAQKKMQAGGVRPMSSAMALNLFKYALSLPSEDSPTSPSFAMSQLMLMDIDWEVFSNSMADTASCHFWQLFAMSAPSDLNQSSSKSNRGVPINRASDEPNQTNNSVSFVQELGELGGEEPYHFVLQHCEDVLREVLCAEPHKSLDIYQGFFDMGLDSMTIVEMREKLDKLTQLSLPSTLLFDYGNLDELAKGIIQLCPAPEKSQEHTSENQHDKMGQELPNGAASAELEKGSEIQEMDAEQVQGLSEQELDQLISEKLEML